MEAEFWLGFCLRTGTIYISNIKAKKLHVNVLKSNDILSDQQLLCSSLVS